MVNIIAQQDCGNAPKKAFLRDFIVTVVKAIALLSAAALQMISAGITSVTGVLMASTTRLQHSNGYEMMKSGSWLSIRSSHMVTMVVLKAH